MYHYQENIVDSNGTALNGWSIGLYAVGGDPETAPAITIYSDRAGTTAIPGGLVRSVAKGFVEFYVPSGAYSRRYYNAKGVYQYAILDSDLDTTGGDLSSTGGAALTGYLAPGTGATAKTVKAVLDGAVRTEDYSTVQQALDYAVSRTVSGNQMLDKVELQQGAVSITAPLLVTEGTNFVGKGAVEVGNKAASRITYTGSGDALRLNGHQNSGDTRWWWYGRIADMTLVGGKNGTTGYGFAGRTSAGDAITFQDSTIIENVTVRGFGSGAMEFPGGGYPIYVGKSKLLFCLGCGIDFTSAASFGHQATHFDNISADACGDAAIKLTNLGASQGTMFITNLKNEGRVNADFGGVENNSNAILIANPSAGARVVAIGIDSICSIPDGANFKKPADLINITGSNVPDVIWMNANARVRAGDTGADPAVLSHAAQGVSIPYTFSAGRYSNLDRIDASQASTVTWLFGNNYTKPNISVAAPAMVLGGATPAYILHDKDDSADLKGAGIFLSGGQLSLRFIKDDNTTLIPMTFTRSGTALGNLQIATSVVPTVDNSFTMGSTSSRWSYVHSFYARTHGLTVATLAAAATAGAGARAFVTDSSVAASGNFGAVVAGGGANGVPVYSDGTNWRIG